MAYGVVPRQKKDDPAKHLMLASKNGMEIDQQGDVEIFGYPIAMFLDPNGEIRW